MPDAAAAPLPALFVSTTLAIGGAQRFTSTLLRHLDRDRVRPALCLLREEIGYPLPTDVPVTAFDYRQPWDGPATVRALAALVEETRPAVVLSNTTATNIIAGMALARVANCHPAWVARIGNSPDHHDGPLRAFLARRSYPRADLFVANSTGLIDGVVRFYPFTGSRIAVLASPTDFDAIDRQAAAEAETARPSDAPLLVAVGRLFPQKRYDVLVEAVARVRKHLPISLWICGEGPERGAILARVQRLRLTGEVHLLGFCRNPFALLRQADLFVMSSDYEGLPNSLIEAQGLGLAAVATRCPYGPEEIVESGRTGLLVPPANPRALAEAVLELLADRGRLRRMGEEAAAHARERFAAVPLTRAWEDLLLGVARRRGFPANT